jgi:hypothetical protein
MNTDIATDTQYNKMTAIEKVLTDWSEACLHLLTELRASKRPMSPNEARREEFYMGDSTLCEDNALWLHGMLPA